MFVFPYFFLCYKVKVYFWIQIVARKLKLLIRRYFSVGMLTEPLLIIVGNVDGDSIHPLVIVIITLYLMSVFIFKLHGFVISQFIAFSDKTHSIHIGDAQIVNILWNRKLGVHLLQIIG